MFRRGVDEAGGLAIGGEDDGADAAQTGDDHDLGCFAAQEGVDDAGDAIGFVGGVLGHDADGRDGVADIDLDVFELDCFPGTFFLGLHESDVGALIAADKFGVEFIGIGGLRGHDDLEFLHLLVGDLRVEEGKGGHDEAVFADDHAAADELAAAKLALPDVLDGDHGRGDLVVELAGGFGRDLGAGEVRHAQCQYRNRQLALH